MIYVLYFLIKPVEATILLFVIISGLLYLNHERRLAQKTSLKNCTNISSLLAEYQDKPAMLEYFVANVYEQLSYKISVTRPTAASGIGILAEKYGIRYSIDVKPYSIDHKIDIEDLKKLHRECVKSTPDRIPIFVATSSFTESAASYAEENGVVLVDGVELERMIAKVNNRLAKKEKALAH